VLANGAECGRNIDLTDFQVKQIFARSVDLSSVKPYWFAEALPTCRENADLACDPKSGCDQSDDLAV
jgi:hypothetical protein